MFVLFIIFMHFLNRKLYFFPSLTNRLRDIYEKIIFLDYEFAQSKEVEQNLWKYVYYKVIEDFRKKIRAVSWRTKFILSFF